MSRSWSRSLMCCLSVLAALGAGCAKRAAPESYDYGPAPAPASAPYVSYDADDGAVQYEERTEIDFDATEISGELTRSLAASAPSGRSYQSAAPKDDSGGTVDFASSARGRTAKGASTSTTAATGTTGSTSRKPSPTSQKPDAATQQRPDAATQQAPEKAKRMVHYNGWVRLRVTRTEDMVDQVAKLAASMGGFTESLTPARITVRVPVERFDEAYAAVRKMGELLDESLTAEDVTDAYTAMDLRLQTAKTSRARLIELLAMAKTEEEKLALLAQIQRLTEEIDVMSAKLRTLASLASMSRLTVEGEARKAFIGRNSRQDVAGFAWISQLSPFRRDVSQQGELLALTVPEGFVALDLKKRLVAESADGAVFWTSRHENQPQGDTAFWMEAVRTRLQSEFASAEVSELGGWKLLRLVEVGEDPYTYLVGLRVDGEHLELVEIYYPGAAQEKRHEAAVRAALGGQS